ncbi:RagB/SusD family nutrient uptake outer membrane protein [Echinicola shivajiensis]|uniref:RagB/SusD family nutrient uptake outer membrane protein n=1 Tax=Echinicola shivajiensis TaxID=1035916 RepID=UPI001BFCC554|nr:RagB/SusD family nutrient uptake outer membrane protein [Echinicola shivajiensis]
MMNLKDKKYRLIALALMGQLLFSSSCNEDFLNTVPDNITTLEDVFTNKNMTEEWLARIYNPIPQMWDQPYGTPWSGQSDEVNYAWSQPAINSGALTPVNTSPNHWDWYYQTIRSAGIFLENIDMNQEILEQPGGPQLITQYKGEVRFLRAYFYWLMMKQYGPIVIMGESTLPPEADFQIPRSTWDECVAYVLSEMDKAHELVPEKHLNPNNPNQEDLQQTGRITKPIIKAVQSQILLYHASPLFNGNTSLGNFKNQDGTVLFNQTYEEARWKDAADAAKEVIDMGLWNLYEVDHEDPFVKGYLSSKELMYNGWETEGIWLRPDNNVNGSWERHCSPRNANGQAWNGIAVTQEMVDDFRMANGKSIDNPTSGYSESGFTSEGSEYYTAGTYNMYVGREPRFYVNVTFNGATVPVVSVPGSDYVEFYFSGNSGKQGAPRDWPITGYTARKNIHPNTDFRSGTNFSRPAMMIRLGEVYLNYIEALNEYSPGHPDILIYLNRIRNRGGLADYDGSTDQATMRKEIRLERQIELMYEGHRYWDVRRWKIPDTEEDHQGGEFHGMNIEAGGYMSDPAFHQRVVAFTRADWRDKFYFYPIPQREIDRNKALVQFPGY